MIAQRFIKAAAFIDIGTIDGDDEVARLQAGLFAGTTRHHTRDDDMLAHGVGEHADPRIGGRGHPLAELDQLVAGLQYAFAGDREDRAPHIGEVQIGDPDQFAARVAYRAARHADVERAGGHAQRAVEHEFPYRIEGAGVGNHAGVGAAFLTAEAGDVEHLLAGGALFGADYLDARVVRSFDFQQA